MSRYGILYRHRYMFRPTRYQNMFPPIDFTIPCDTCSTPLRYKYQPPCDTVRYMFVTLAIHVPKNVSIYPSSQPASQSPSIYPSREETSRHGTTRHGKKRNDTGRQDTGRNVTARGGRQDTGRNVTPRHGTTRQKAREGMPKTAHTSRPRAHPATTPHVGAGKKEIKKCLWCGRGKKENTLWLVGTQGKRK